MTAIAARPCAAGCGSTVRRARGFGVCRACHALAEAWFARHYGAVDPNAWVRARNLTFGNREALLAVIRAERAALAVAV